MDVLRYQCVVGMTGAPLQHAAAAAHAAMVVAGTGHGQVSLGQLPCRVFRSRELRDEQVVRALRRVVGSVPSAKRVVLVPIGLQQAAERLLARTARRLKTRAYQA